MGFVLCGTKRITTLLAPGFLRCHPPNKTSNVGDCFLGVLCQVVFRDGGHGCVVMLVVQGLLVLQVILSDEGNIRHHDLLPLDLVDIPEHMEKGGLILRDAVTPAT